MITVNYDQKKKNSLLPCIVRDLQRGFYMLKKTQRTPFLYFVNHFGLVGIDGDTGYMGPDQKLDAAIWGDLEPVDVEIKVLSK